jgi:hypothetical protein
VHCFKLIMMNFSFALLVLAGLPLPNVSFSFYILCILKLPEILVCYLFLSN